MALHPGAVRVLVEVAEAAREGELIVWDELLVGEHEDEVLEECPMHLVKGRVVECPQVDVDLGADQSGERRHRHGLRWLRGGIHVVVPLDPDALFCTPSPQNTATRLVPYDGAARHPA